MTSERAVDRTGETWRCPSCRDTVVPMGMCQKCGVFGLRYESRAAIPAPREDGWEELRREIEALPREFCAGDPPVAVVRRAAVLAIVDRLAAARGEPPEPGPAIDVERLRLVFHEEYGHGHGYLGCQHKNQHPKSWDCFQRATEVASEYDRLRP